MSFTKTMPTPSTMPSILSGESIELHDIFISIRRFNPLAGMPGYEANYMHGSLQYVYIQM